LLGEGSDASKHGTHAQPLFVVCLAQATGKNAHIAAPQTLQGLKQAGDADRHLKV
jgi:hypothetical protein